MKKNTLEEDIAYAIREAMMLEYAMERFKEERVLEVAQNLSKAPYSFVEQIYFSKYGKVIHGSESDS